MSIFEELKRRNVFRVAAAYLVGGWVLVQVADAFFPALNLPEWTTRLVAGLVVLGFPIALLISWAFEVTPEGIKRESQADHDNVAARVSAKRLDVATIIGVVVAIGLFSVQQLREPAAPTSPAPVDVAAVAGPSVAVLAFENMSPDPDNAFFAEGISEEILNVLAAIKGLRVASRTSAFSFANTDTPIPEIASQLDVAHVLEGSVRKQGTRVRITAQLIDADNDTHLWSETYDRELDDIFVVQEEIAIAISKALMGALGMSNVSVAAPTSDLAAYELFLRGRQEFYKRGREPLATAVADFAAAVALDPDFADAWSFLAASLRTLPGYSDMSDAEIDDFVQRADTAAERALALDPNQALAVAVQGQNMSLDDRLRGLEMLARAVAMAPNNAGILMWAGDELYLGGGYVDESLPLLERAYRLDPLSGINNGVLGIHYLASGQRELGRQHIRRATELGWRAAESTLILDLLWTGEIEAAIALLRSQFPKDDGTWTDLDHEYWDIYAPAMRGEISSDELSARAQTKPIVDEDAESLILAYTILGYNDPLLDAWIDSHEYEDSDARVVFVPSGRAIAEHPKFFAYAKQRNLLSLWEAKGYPMGCDRVSDASGEHLSCQDWPK